MMVITGVAAGVIVAVGTITSGVIKLVHWISERVREKDKERAERAQVAADLDDLKRRILGQ